MVKFSDIIRNDVKDREEAQKAGNSLRFSALKEFNTSLDSDTLPEQKDVENIEQLYSTIAGYLGEVRKRVVNNESFELKQAVDTVNHIINTPDLIENFYQSTTLSSDDHNNEDYLITHLINVLIYSLKIGTGLKYPVEELLELGLAALLYDIGFFKIPESITGKKSKLTETELNTVK
ncbi:MAG: hypothetical protein COW04_12645, partial [Deltaproteobacteria bacterium CG12_big_fil_rev_8_21_14_0_65_43_10]